MNKYNYDPLLGKKLKEAIKYLTEAQGWNTWADYEQEVLKSWKDKNDALPISHPNYERMKAYMQGQINALSYLIDSRNGIKEGRQHGNRRSKSPTPSGPDFSEGFGD